MYGEMSLAYRIRQAEKRDAEDIFRIVKACEAQGFVYTTSTVANYKYAIRKRSRFYVIEDKDGIQGFMLGAFKKELGIFSPLRLRVTRFTSSNFFYVLQICIDPRAQRKGYGKALNDSVFEGLSPHFPVYLSIDSKNMPSVNFHRSLGYIFVTDFIEKQKGKGREGAIKMLYRNTPLRYRSHISS